MRLVVNCCSLVLATAVLLWCIVAAIQAAEPENQPAAVNSSQQATGQAEQSATASSVGKQDGEATSAWRYQRLLVPADRPEDWPRDKSQRYLPMPAEEFAKRLAQLRGMADAGQSQAARLIRAKYTAALTGEGALAGELSWEFEANDAQRGVAMLGDCALALDDFRWADNLASNKHAVVGNDVNGRLCAVVDRSGTMTGRWSLPGKRELDEMLSFDLQLPSCQSSTLQLTLPADLAPALDHGVVTAGESTPSGTRHWQIECGGNLPAKLRIVKQAAAAYAPEKTFVRQSLTYEFSARGLEFNGDFQLDALGAPLPQIKLQVASSLTIVKVRLGETELPRSAISRTNLPAENVNLSTAATDADSSETQEITIALPQPIHGLAQKFQISAIAPTTLNKPWRLPQVRVKNSDWQTGTVRVVMPDSLMLDELSSDDCRQTNLETLPESSPGEAYELACFNDHPRIQLTISPRQEKVQLTQGTSVSLRANEGTSRYRAEITTDQGELFALQAEIAPQWIIESVESFPAGMITDWSQQAARNRPGKLSLQLSTPLTPHQSLRLLINGRRRSAPWGETLHADDLAMLHFSAALVSRRLIHVQAIEAFQLQLRGAGDLTRLDPARLSSADALLLDEKPTDLVFVDDVNARNLAVSLIGKTPQYDADIQAEALLGDNRLTESYRFALTPQGREVSHFEVRFSQPRATPIMWSIDGEPSVVLTARRLTEAEGQTSNWPGELWEVALPQPRATPFVMLARRTSPLADDMPLALASFSEAETQRGTIQVISAAHSRPTMRSRRLKAISVDLPTSDQYATALAAFRYDPEEDTLLTADPPLVLIPHANNDSLPQAWIWQAELTSRYSRAGAEHTLNYKVENAGQEKLQFQPPPGATLRSAWIDGLPAAELSSVTTGVWKINLPPAARFVTVTLCYSEGQAEPGTVAAHTAAWPGCDIPILSRQWSVWTPPGMAITDAMLGHYRPLDVPWNKRIFGPLAPTAKNPNAISPESATNPVRPTEQEKTVPTPATLSLQSPWKAASENQPADVTGWNYYAFDSVGSADQIWIADTQSLASWAWISFVLAVALRWCLDSRTLAVDIGLLGTATAVALLIPASWTPVSAAVWLGLVVGRLAASISQRSQLSSTEGTSKVDSGSNTAKFASVSSAVCLFIALAARSLLAADGENRQASPSSATPPVSVQKVLVPVDADGHPTGGLYYLPEAFHDELLRAAAEVPAPPQYLITRATYEDRAEQNQNSQINERGGDWQATFDIESLGEQTVVQLPLGFHGAALAPDSVKLDGQPTAFRGDEKLQRLLVEVNHEGSHRLEVQLHPAIHSAEFDFTVPVVSNTHIDLTGRTANSSDATVDAAATRHALQKQHIWLGPVDRITSHSIATLSKSRTVNFSAPPAVFDVDELYWLRILPDSVAVNARFHLHVRSGSVQQLHLLADPRWRPLLANENNSTEHALPADAVAVSHLAANASNPNEFVIELARPVAGQATVDVTFRLDSNSGIGCWQPLSWQISGANSKRHWWGVSVHPALDLDPVPIAKQNRISPEQYAALWPTRDAQPQIAWQTNSPTDSVSIVTRLRQPKLSAQYDLAAIAGQNEVELHWAARVATADGAVFQYRVQIPQQMVIDSVEVRKQDATFPCRWSRSRANLLSVFLAVPAEGQRVLLVRGRLPTANQTKVAVPEITIAQALSEGYRTFVFRRPEVLVNMADSPASKSLPEIDFAAALADAQRNGLVGQAGPSPELPSTESEKLVAVLAAQSSAPSIQLQIERNQPQLQAIEVTTLDRSAEAWRATVDVELHIESGVVDALRFDLPSNWIGPFEVSPSMPQMAAEVPGENRQQLILRPEAPLQHNVHLQIKGPLTIAAGGRPAAPDVRLLGVFRQTQFFALPRRVENQQLAWDTRGLFPRQLPEAASVTLSDPSVYRCYQLVSDSCRATLRSVERSSDNPQVRLVDVTWSWDADGNYRGVAAFDLEPASATSCELQLPTDEHLIQVQLDAAPAQLSALGENHWNVWLGDNKLPRHLEVMFAGTNEQTLGKAWQLTAPTLVDLSVERTLWSVWAPPEAGVGTLPAGLPISPLQHQQVRLEGVAALMDSATGLLLEESADDVTRWYAPWLRRFQAYRAEFIQAKSAEPAADQVQDAEAELSAIDQEQSRLARRLQNTNPDKPSATQSTTVTQASVPAERVAASNPSTASSQPITATDWLQLAGLVQPAGRNAALAMVRSQGGPLSLEYSHFTFTGWKWRWAGAAGILAVTIALLLALQLRWIHGVPFAHGPPLLGLAIGLAWWLWLTPSLVGLAIIAVSLYFCWQYRALKPA